MTKIDGGKWLFVRENGTPHPVGLLGYDAVADADVIIYIADDEVGTIMKNRYGRDHRSVDAESLVLIRRAASLARLASER
jgi:hypothetical protein